MSEHPVSLLPTTVLIVDDDPDVLIAARLALASAFDRVESVSTPEAGAAMLPHIAIDAVLLDMNFARGDHSGREGLDWLERFRTIAPDVSVVLMTAYGGIAVAVDALKRGAVDFVLKPWQNEKLVATMRAAASLTQARRESSGLRQRNDALTQETSAKTSEILGASAALRRMLDLIGRCAPTDANVLILGESGTGKELTAREIHARSRRSKGPFVSVDLGAVSENLFESELFGHRRGAFTGAHSDRIGRVQAADGGTLFLDEIGNLPLHLQRKLLTVIERREVIPVGATQPKAVDIRLVTATNRPIAELVREDIFRQDLLFRIRTVELCLPPLRERQEDIALLLEHYLAFYARKHNMPRRRLSPSVLEALERYAWPGNVRELRHAAERATILSADEQLSAPDFPFLMQAPVEAIGPAGFDLDSQEAETIARALAQFQGNISQAAAALGLTRPALYRRMAKHGL